MATEWTVHVFLLFIGFFDYFCWVEKPIYTQDVVIFTFPVPISCGLGVFEASICISRRVALINRV